jgi:hypothetical protein
VDPFIILLGTDRKIERSDSAASRHTKERSDRVASRYFCCVKNFIVLAKFESKLFVSLVLPFELRVDAQQRDTRKSKPACMYSIRIGLDR